jgi:hypothetical protein
MTGPQTKNEWAEIDPATVAPLKDGKPDLYNFMPTRFVPKQEAEARGWKWFYIGDSCRWGHKAPHYVSNPRMCVDCHRVREGRLPIGAKGDKEYKGQQKQYEQRKVDSPSAIVPAMPRPLEPDVIEKKFLTEYAARRDFAQAALACGKSEAEFLGRLSYDEIFRAAVYRLEEDLGLARTASVMDDFEWTDDKRTVLMRVYIDTGDMLKAMRAVGVSNYHYMKELEENPDFRSDMERAEILAIKQLDRDAISKAKDGDSRLLQRVLAAKMPEQYGEKVKMDLNVTEKLTDDQLNSRLAQVFERLGGRIVNSAPAIDAGFTVIEPRRETPALEHVGNSSPSSGAQSNMDLV